MADGTCALPECEKPKAVCGYCRRHYRLNKLYGDPHYSRHTPNVHSQEADGSWSVLVTRQDGSTHALRYDAEDAFRVQSCTWWMTSSGYGYTDLVTSTDPKARRTRCLMHRFVLGLGRDSTAIVDHANGKRGDNRKENLSVGSNQDNAVNRAVTNAKGTSRFRGVSYDRFRGAWAAHVGHLYKLHHIGRFSTEEAAAAAVAKFREDMGLPSGY